MTLSAPRVAASGIGRRLRFNRRSAAGCTGLHAVFGFNVNIPAEYANTESVDGRSGIEPILVQIRDVTRKDLLIPPGESSSGGALSVEALPGGKLTETSSPSSAPDLMPAGDQAAPVPSPAPSPAPSEAAARRNALRLRERARQMYHRADKHAVAPSAWRHFSSNVRCTTCTRSLSTST